jgi:hypothetical protein
MTTRFILLIVLITFLAMITVWQEVQSVRLGYSISDLIKQKNALIRENTSLTIQLAHLKSPDSLWNQAKIMQVDVVYPNSTKTDQTQAPTKLATKKPKIKNRYSKAKETR